MKKKYIAFIILAILAAVIAVGILISRQEPTATTEPTTPGETTRPTELTTVPTVPTEPTQPTEPATVPTEPIVPPTEPTAPPTEPTEPSHQHEYAEEVVAPTCTEGGYTTYTCSCGDTYRDKDIGALGHSFGAYVSNGDANCILDGTMTAKCDRCGETHTVPDDGSALGHTYEKEVVDPTCVDAGCTVYTCSVCGDTHTSDETAATGHAWGEWVITKSPTEETEGKRERACVACGESEEEVLDKTVHIHGYTITHVSPTCTEQGYSKYTCECGESYKEDYTAALGHAYVKNVTKPTCTVDGYTTYTCSDCGDFYTDDVVKANGHSYKETVTAATCTDKGNVVKVCSACGDKVTSETPALGHNFGDWTTVVAPDCEKSGEKVRECARCGEKETETIAAKGHDYQESGVEATCTEAGSVTKTCKICGDVVTETVAATGHDWSEWVTTKTATTTEEGERVRKCKKCGTTETESIPKIEESHTHTFVDVVVPVTCTEDGYTLRTCTGCGRSAKSKWVYAEGHDWSGWETTQEPAVGVAGSEQRTCSTCGEVDVVAIPALNDDGEEYESYIDPAVEIEILKSSTRYTYNDIQITDERNWGEAPSILVNENESLTVVYYNQGGERVEIPIDAPPEGYTYWCAILADGTYVLHTVGDFG